MTGLGGQSQRLDHRHLHLHAKHLWFISCSYCRMECMLEWCRKNKVMNRFACWQHLPGEVIGLRPDCQKWINSGGHPKGVEEKWWDLGPRFWSQECSENISKGRVCGYNNLEGSMKEMYMCERKWKKEVCRWNLKEVLWKQARELRSRRKIFAKKRMIRVKISSIFNDCFILNMFCLFARLYQEELRAYPASALRDHSWWIWETM